MMSSTDLYFKRTNMGILPTIKQLPQGSRSVVPLPRLLPVLASVEVDLEGKVPR